MDIPTVTLIVLVVQAIIYGLILLIMWQANKATKISAEGARKSAQAATDAVEHARDMAKKTERAVIVIESVEVANITTPAAGLESHNVIVFTLKNFGQTIANLVKLTGKMSGMCQWPFPDIPTSNIAPQGTFSWATSESVGVLLGGENNIRTINERRGSLEYRVSVTYIDVFKNGHTYHCEGRYEPALKRFLITASTSD